MTVADCARHIGAQKKTVRHWNNRGEHKASTFGTRIGYRIRRADYNAFLTCRTRANLFER